MRCAAPATAPLTRAAALRATALAQVLPMLPKLLGKSFFKKSKQPAAVDLTRKNVREALRQARAPPCRPVACSGLH